MKKIIFITLIIFAVISAKSQKTYLLFQKQSDFLSWIKYVRRDYLMEDRYGKQCVDVKFSIRVSSWKPTTKVRGYSGYIILLPKDTALLYSPSKNFKFSFYNTKKFGVKKCTQKEAKKLKL